ncbi:MAG TPA: FkbM family methyltransferase [Paracoccaceae bacterium]|nr:FkbM family methyltransferase [Paracoccaceae bacterium]HMO71841.1 FkbM family methyltransferase [Paracoccaceae bacterium]
MPGAMAAAERDDLRRRLRRQGLVAVPDKAGAAHLAAFGLAPDVVFDVGVDRGTPALYRAFPQALFVLVDPRPEARDAMQGQAAPAQSVFHEVALGAVEGAAELSIPVTSRGAEGARASLLRPVGPMARAVTGYQTRKVPVTTLDALADAYPGRVGLKIDVEGQEVAVLEGGRATLSRSDFAILEISLTERFDATPRPSRIFALLAEAGLEFRDVLRTTGDGAGGPAPRLIDALFTRWPAAPEAGA